MRVRVYIEGHGHLLREPECDDVGGPSDVPPLRLRLRGGPRPGDGEAAGLLQHLPGLSPGRAGPGRDGTGTGRGRRLGASTPSGGRQREQHVQTPWGGPAGDARSHTRCPLLGSPCTRRNVFG